MELEVKCFSAKILLKVIIFFKNLDTSKNTSENKLIIVAKDEINITIVTNHTLFYSAFFLWKQFANF